MHKSGVHTLKKLQWDIRVPIFRNLFILRGLLLAVGIPFGILIAIIIAAAHGDVIHSDAKYALFMTGLLFLLTYLFILLLYGGKYAAHYVVDEIGVLNETQRGQAKKNAVVNGLLVVLGLFSRNPAAAGAGLLTASRQSVLLRWDAVRHVKYDAKRKTILLRGGPTEKIAVFCTPDNYAAVEAAVRENIG